MRILMLAALLGGGLCAQTPPVKPFEPSPNPAALEQMLAVRRRLCLALKSASRIAPSGDCDAQQPAGQGLPAIIPHVTPAPNQPCSIPLLNVVPKSGFNGDPKIAIMGSQTLANIDHMPLIQGAPPCPRDQR